MMDARSWLIAYRLALDLPDEGVRRARLEGLDQSLVDEFWQQGFLLARPTVTCRFEAGTPQGHVRAGAKAQCPGLLVMRSDALGRVSDAAGQPSELEGDAAVVHRWSALLHEASHFSFEQLSSTQLVEALPAGWEALHEPLAQHLWAPFLANIERTRLNEAFADGHSSALLLGWGSPISAVRPELERLAHLRHVTHERHVESGSCVPWRHGPSAVVRRILGASAWDQCTEPSLLRRSLLHSVGGIVDRWQDQGPAALAQVGQAWCSVQLERVCEAFLHARRHHDTSMVEQWLGEHPGHPIMIVAQALRWQAPISEQVPTRPWHAAWEKAIEPHLDEIGDAWDHAEPLLLRRWASSPRPRAPRLR